MKIGQPTDFSVFQNSPPSASAVTTLKRAPDAAAQAAIAASQSTPASGVEVTVSSQTRALDQANRSESSDIDMDKVNAVRDAIANGTYVVNPQAIADKLLSNAQEMLTPTTQH